MANVAQLVEPRFVVPVVVSSSLIVRPRFKISTSNEVLFLYLENHALDAWFSKAYSGEDDKALQIG